MLIRHIWLIALPLALGTFGSLTVSRRLPNKYRSETVILLLPQRVPDSYVKSTVTEKLEDRLVTLESQILSRSRLERIILDLNLYSDRRRHMPMEDVVQRMRDDISIRTEGKDALSFRVSYVNNDARVAQKTAERLASLFIEENLRDRENQAEETNQFLDSQLQDARLRLIAQEKRLEEYRQRYNGQLPTQAANNLQSLQSLQFQIQSLSDAMDRGRERRILLERQVSDLETTDPVVPQSVAAIPAGGSDVIDPSTGGSTAQQLDSLKARLKVLQLRLKPDHPDIRAIERTIRELTAKAESESKTASPVVAPPQPLRPAESAKAKRLADLRAEITVIDHELEVKQQQETKVRSDVAALQSRLDAVPTRESELVELTRDYATLQATYQSLLAKREDSKLAANLERRNIGEQFKVLDPARVPERPFSPNRLVIGLGGSGGGLMAGCLLIALLEYRRRGFQSQDDVERLCQLPVLALVPVMASDAERRRRRTRRVASLALATMLSLASVITFVVLWRFDLL